jgi:hypothetical protein
MDNSVDDGDDNAHTLRSSHWFPSVLLTIKNQHKGLAKGEEGIQF